MPRERLAPEVFRLPVERLRRGYYSDAYFTLTKELLEAEDRHPHVTMQVFQKQHAILGGVDEAVALLKQCAGLSRWLEAPGCTASVSSRCTPCTRAMRSSRARRS